MPGEPGRAVKPSDVLPSRNPGCSKCGGKGQKYSGRLCECAMRRFLKANQDSVAMGDDPERPGERTLIWTEKRRAVGL